MTYLYYSPYRLGSPSFYLLLDHAIVNLEANKELQINFLLCAGEIKNCNSNLNGSKLVCLKCNIISSAIIKKYKNPRLHFIYIDDYLKNTDSKLKGFYNLTSLTQLKEITYKNINIGLGVASSFVSAYRNLDPSFNHTQKNYFKRLLNTSVYVYESLEIIIAKLKPQRIILFNGRFSDLRIVLELSKKHKIDFNTIEFEFIQNPLKIHAIEYLNTLPHDIGIHTKRIEELWKNTDDYLRNKLAEEFFSRRRNGDFTNDQTYIKKQKQRSLPDSWDSNKKNYVIFNSSEDENIALGGEYDIGNIFEKQIDGIKWICEYLKNFEDIHLTLRIHPNLAGLKFKYVQNLNEEVLNYKNLTIIPPESDISSYALIDEADRIIVFNSTIGIEACYWGKPVISLDTTLYDNLKVTYIPKKLNELSELLTKDLKPMPQLGSLKYGLYFNSIKGQGNVYVDFNYVEKKFFNRKIKIISELTNINPLKQIVLTVISIFLLIKAKLNGVNKEILDER